MFKRKVTTTALTYIAHGSMMTGETQFAGDALIAGELNGVVLAEGMITIDQGGLIEGETQCHEIKISGTYKGKLICDKLTITGTGILEGEVVSSNMEIFEGGQFIGIRNKSQSPQSPSEPKLVNPHQDPLPISDSSESNIAH